MPQRGTASVTGAYLEFQAAVLKALPRELKDELALAWAKNGEALEKVLHSLSLPPVEASTPLPSAIPADDEWFDLEVDDDVDPMAVVASAGYDPKGWKYLGPKLTGKRTLRVKLVRLGPVRNLKEAEEKADAMGCRLVEGQAREPFKAKFPKPDGKGPILFGGSQWQYPFGNAYVAFLYGLGGEWFSLFFWADRGFSGRWRWPVVGK